MSRIPGTGLFREVTEGHEDHAICVRLSRRNPRSRPDAMARIELHVVNALFILWRAFEWPAWTHKAIETPVKKAISASKPVRAQA